MGLSYITFRRTEVELFKLPLVPVMVMVEVPGSPAVVIVNVEDTALAPATVTQFAVPSQVVLKMKLNPLASRMTSPVNPPDGVTVTV